MATSRKRPSSGFSQSPSEELPEVVIHEEVSTVEETVETKVEATVKETVEEVAPTPVPFVEETIIPTEDPGPRFVVVETSQPPIEAPPAVLKAPKRHPRNIPKFSGLAK